MSAVAVPRHALITAFVSKTRDRFHEYNQVKTFDERLEVVSHLDGFSGVEIIHPYEVPDAKTCKALLKKHKLQAAAINVNVKAEPEFHINDNNGKWDWDYMVASDNLLQYIEFLYYLQENGYKDFLTSDTSPTRWDIQGTFEANSRVTNKLWRLVAELDKKELRRLLRGGDFLKTWRFIETRVLGLKD